MCGYSVLFSDRIHRVRKLIVAYPAISSSSSDVRVSHSLLDRGHADTGSVQARRERPASGMAARADACAEIDRFEAQAQADVAEMPASARAANECPAVVQIADRGEIGVEQLAKLVRDEHAP